ncbi:MAG: HEAT repeat domain-containing protein [Polyangiaceae bacterium]|nr:HEAT repeat domain-containing protein [Polyangiaceae bacterium]
MSAWADVERALSADDAEERRRAAASLRRPSSEVPVKLLMRALSDSDWRVRKEAVLTAVALAPSPEVLSALVAALGPGDNVGERNSAVEALADYGVHAIGALAHALGDLDADGRKLVVDVLALGARPEALPLLKRLLKDPDVNVRGAAVEAVAAIGEGCAEEAIAILDECLDSLSRFERLAALQGLERLSATLPWERLEPLASDPILLPAVLALAGRSGAEPAVPALLDMLAAARGRTFADALASLVELSRTSARAHERLGAGLREAPAQVRETILALCLDEDGQPGERRNALCAAGLLGSDAAARAAVAALADDALAEQAEATLTELGSAAVAALVAGAEGPTPEQRAACLSLLGPLVALDPDANAAAKRALGDAAPEVVAAALDALAAAGDRAALQDAAGLLGAAPVVAQAAHRALATLARRHPADALGLVRSASPSGAGAEAAAIVIEALGASQPDVGAHVAFLAAALGGPIPTARRAALSALSALGGSAALEPVAFALNDEELEVRIAAIRALGRLSDETGRPLGVEHLTEIARLSSDRSLVAAAARALGEVGDARAVPVLGELLGREPVVAVAALEALGAFAGVERDEHVVSALSHADSEVVKSAMRVLASASDPRAASRLGVCLEHTEWDVRRLAAELLGTLGCDEALALLRGRLSLERQDLVREELTRAITDAETLSGRRRTAPPPSLRGMRRQ